MPFDLTLYDPHVQALLRQCSDELDPAEAAWRYAALFADLANKPGAWWVFDLPDLLPS